MSTDIKTNSKSFVKYETQLIAFLDVLGFSDLVKDNIPNEVIQKYFSIATSYLSIIEDLHPEEKLQTMLISDSIVVAIPFHKKSESLKYFFSAISSVQFELAKINIWLRGGISVGQLYMDKGNNIVVGPGLVKAYHLENLAKVPRVIIDPIILNLMNMDRKDFSLAMNDNLKIDSEWTIFDHERIGAYDNDLFKDAIFINFFDRLRRGTDTNNFKAVYNAIKSNIYSKQEQYSKYRWLTEYCAYCTSGSQRQLFECL